MNDRVLDKISVLHDELKKMSKNNNRVTVEKFSKFIPLFRKDSNELPADTISDLTIEFTSTFDIYEHIYITDDEDNVLMVIPRIFLPVKDISEKFDNVVADFHSNSKSTIPKYVSEATSNLLNVLVASQGENKHQYAETILRYTKEYLDITRKFMSTKKGGNISDSENDISLDNILEW
jgi:hypothetical protein